ncbi:helix-turn-helix domain-containing protein [Novosphingobium gossypii]|uniref:helix-turn-helix domain-containing protein n=1 Tax=Novosphingobium gossypii TaxID=1604774 RepID=UPI003D1ACF54
MRVFARRRGDAQQAQRLFDDGLDPGWGRRNDAAKIGGVTLQIVRDWVIRFNAEGPDGPKSSKGLWLRGARQGRSRPRMA